MRILVTGATGYLGSHLCLDLIQAGHQVVGLDNFCSSDRELLPTLHKLAGHAFQFVEGNVQDTACLRSLFLRHQPQLVIHLAASRQGSTDNPLPMFGSNVSGLLALLNVMERYDVRRLLYCSSASIYGSPGNLPVAERDPIAPQDSQARSKAFCERILNDLCKSNPDWHIVQLRPFNIVGSHPSARLPLHPKGHPNLLSLLHKVTENQHSALLVEGGDLPTPDGSAVRDYLHIADFGRACLATLPLLDAQAGSLTLNIGSGQGSSVYDLLRTYARISQRAIAFDIGPAREGSPAALYGSCERALQLLNWRATHSLADICGEDWRQGKQPAIRAEREPANQRQHARP